MQIGQTHTECNTAQKQTSSFSHPLLYRSVEMQNPFGLCSVGFGPQSDGSGKILAVHNSHSWHTQRSAYSIHTQLMHIIQCILLFFENVHLRLC